MNRRIRSALIVLQILTVGHAAFGHAFTDRSEPRVGSTVSAPPAVVRIWFTQEPEVAFSKIQVFGADGRELDKQDTHADEKDPRELIVSLPVLSAGTYRVAWRVMSVDTHKTRGDFKFSVRP